MGYHSNLSKTLYYLKNTSVMIIYFCIFICAIGMSPRTQASGFTGEVEVMRPIGGGIQEQNLARTISALIRTHQDEYLKFKSAFNGGRNQNAPIRWSPIF